MIYGLMILSLAKSSHSYAMTKGKVPLGFKIFKKFEFEFSSSWQPA